ncbi:uncharacterized protein DDB_G0283357-like [Rhagoletis pomonella]|uniref:uncharacterized protein DDB_G0283357-like n=1 Tax=Rhagoletis pomonella TaxID=28610 RepID=UPI0017848C90|nr:uncharacterized protein DDB_G0283357-like [Rhagoletis pomonella]
MINLPAPPSGHSPNSLSATTPADCITESSPHCEYNFLKRKFEGDTSPTGNNVNANVTGNHTAEYQNASCTTPVWKKRHMQESSDTITESNCFTTPVANYNSYSSTNNNDNLLIDAIQTENLQNDISISPSATLTTNNNSAIINNNNSIIADNEAINNNNNNNNNSNNNSNMTFNLITGNSSFINDLFAYDANLIVPVTASLVSHSTNGADSQLPAFAAPSNVCVNTNYDDGSNWQASDLLELDHRYNSGLQTEIAHLHPTLPLKATEITTLNAVQQSQEVTHQQPQQQQQQQQQAQSSSPTQFLVPEKQVSRSPVNSANPNRYRQQQTLQQSINQALPQIPQSMPQTSTAADTEADFEDKNLSWLLNFKFDEFPHLSPDLGANSNNHVNTNVLNAGVQQGNSISSPSSFHKSNSCSPQSSFSAATPLSSMQQPFSDYTRSPKSSTKAGKKFEELVMEVTAEVDGADMVVAENVVVENSPQRAPKKPPFTYTELIEYALEDKGELTVSGIYQWIS